MSERILVADDEAGLREMLGVLLRRAGYAVSLASGCKAAREQLAQAEPFDLVITDLAMPDGSGMDVLSDALAADDTTQVIMITAFATTEQAVEAMRRGAYDYVQKPFKNSELLAQIEKALEKRHIVRDNRALRAQVRGDQRLGNLLGKGPAMRHVMSVLSRVASGRASVLITGESGTGKEVVARTLHDAGDRKEQPFIVVNCGALPEALMESELFGHEKGAFTGANARKEGLVRAAHDGTLFLDEVGELPGPLQVKLLRVLQERAVRPVGGHEEIPVNVRVVAATNVDVEQAVEAGSFRQDLFYRLNVIRIELPPLRERAEDIPLLAEHFLHKHAALEGRRLSFAADAIRWLMQQPFPGNVRELENMVERAVALAAEDSVTVEDLSMRPQPAVPTEETPTVLPDGGLDLDAHLGRIEKSLLLQALDRSQGVRTNAAKLLHTSFRSFRYRLAKYGLDEGNADEGSSEPTSGSELK